MPAMRSWSGGGAAKLTATAWMLRLRPLMVTTNSMDSAGGGVHLLGGDVAVRCGASKAWIEMESSDSRLRRSSRACFVWTSAEIRFRRLLTRTSQKPGIE
ncbi:hypothetical protein V5799_007301 [Amblyomma americanum]|uniref:Uncharacterized protein n=1 Tax=Amblyomma americanum TaxID=6943 RepID=A0AAQ4DTX7_AMBAM